MENNPEFQKNSLENLSEGDLANHFRGILEEHGQRIDFNIGERPVKNFFKGRGIIRATKRISNRSLLVIDTDSMSGDPFDTTKDLHIWRKTFPEGKKRTLKPTDTPRVGESYIRVVSVDDNDFLVVETELPYSSGRQIVGDSSEAQEILGYWLEGRPLDLRF